MQNSKYIPLILRRYNKPKKVTISKTDNFFIAIIQQNIIIPTEKIDEKEKVCP